MSKQKESLSISMAKAIMVVAIIASLGAALGVAGYAVKNKSVKIQQPQIFTEEEKNPAAEYFKNCELQYDTEDQKENIETALNDILNLSEEELKEKRYKDYAGKENQWDLSTLIYRHCVWEEGKTLGGNFFRDIKENEAQEEVKQILEKYFEKDETADWKTYRNEEYGFEFKYPKDWTIENFEVPAMISFGSLVSIGLNKKGYSRLPDTDMPNSVNFYLYKSIAELDSEKISPVSLEDYLDKYSALSDPVYKNVISKKIGSLDGYEANAGSNQFGGGKYFFTELPTKQVVSFWLFNEKNDQGIMNQILSTFKFIEK